MPAQPHNNFRSISYRLTLYVGAFSLFITIIIVCVLLFNNYFKELADSHKRLTTLQETVTPPLAQAMWEFNQHNMQALLNGILQTEDIDHVQLDIISTIDNRSITLGKMPTSSFFTIISKTTPVFHKKNNIQLGQLTITSSTKPIFKRIKESAGQILISISVIIFLAAFFIIWIINRILTHHLRDISNFMAQLNLSSLAQNLSLKRQNSKQHSDELDVLVTSINNMRQHLIDDIEQRQLVEFELNQEKQEKFKLEQQQKITLAASQAKGDFLAAMSHEIRTPMNGVMGMLDILSKTTLDQNQLYYLNMAITSSESLRYIIDDILDYSKLDAGKMILETRPFNLETLLSECLQSVYIEAYNKNIFLFADINSKIDTQFYGDPNRLRQVIINLLSNAIKFTHDGLVTIKVNQFTDSTQESKQLHISIIDTGIGIAKEKQRLLFNPFTQADQSTSRNFGGTGLGLAICKQLMTLMQGDISVESRPNEGSQFNLRLPLKQQETDSVRLANITPSGTLLFISTNHYLQDALVKHLSRYYKNIKIAQTTQDAISCLQNRQQYRDCIIDFQEKGILNFEQLRPYCQNQSHCPIYIICPPTEALTQEQLDYCNAKQYYHPLTSLQLQDIIHPRIKTMHSTSSAQDPDLQFPHLKALVVDDNEINRLVAKGFLQRLSINTILAESGEQALQLIEQTADFDIIFMDCEMPGMDGFTTTKNIRSIEQQKQLHKNYIVALTANVFQQHKEQSLAAGMDDFLAKPLKDETLKQCLRDFMLIHKKH